MAENNQLNALLVHHIGDLEAAVKHVKISVDKRLWTEAADLFKNSIDETSFACCHDAEGKDVSFSHRLWLSAGNKGENEDAWVGLDSVNVQNNELDETWLASFWRVSPLHT